MRSATLYCFIFALLCCGNLIADTNNFALLSFSEATENISDTVAKTTIPKATLKINLPCLIDPLRQSLFFATDIRVAEKWSLDVGTGWFFNNVYDAKSKGETYNGLRARLGFKYYYTLKNKNPHYTSNRNNTALYIGFEAKYNLIVSNKYETVCRYGCQYRETLLSGRNHSVYGGVVKTGIHVFMGEKKKMFFDFYAGVGYRMVHIKETSLPNDASQFTQRDFFSVQRTPGKYHLPDIITGFYLGYKF